jgi:hypothetical protein
LFLVHMMHIYITYVCSLSLFTCTSAHANLTVAVHKLIAFLICGCAVTVQAWFETEQRRSEKGRSIRF